jgi:hypothetical protein
MHGGKTYLDDMLKKHVISYLIECLNSREMKHANINDLSLSLSLSLIGSAYHPDFTRFYSRDPLTQEMQCLPLLSCLGKLLKGETRTLDSTTNAKREEFQMKSFQRRKKKKS